MLQTKNIFKKGPHGFIKFGNLYTKYRGGVSKFGNPVTEFDISRKSTYCQRIKKIWSPEKSNVLPLKAMPQLRLSIGYPELIYIVFSEIFLK